MSAPYDDGPLPDEEFRRCYVCFRPDCPGHRPATPATTRPARDAAKPTAARSPRVG